MAILNTAVRIEVGSVSDSPGNAVRTNEAVRTDCGRLGSPCCCTGSTENPRRGSPNGSTPRCCASRPPGSPAMSRYWTSADPSRRATSRRTHPHTTHTNCRACRAIRRNSGSCAPPRGHTLRARRWHLRRAHGTKRILSVATRPPRCEPQKSRSSPSARRASSHTDQPYRATISQSF